MRKIVISILTFVFMGVSVKAQIEVGTNNNVAIGISGNVNSKLSVNTIGNSNWTGFVNNTGTGSGKGAFLAKKVKPGSGSYGYGMFGICYAGNGYAFGVKGYAYSSTQSSTGRSYGMYGYAGNAKSGFNYAVYGRLAGLNNGAGVYGTTYGDTYIDGKYAGYFYGNAKVTGTLWYGVLSQTSDSTAKKNKRKLRGENVKKLQHISAYMYQYKTPVEMGIVTDTASYEISDEMDEFYKKDHIGIMAQELQKEYPELVTVDQNGILGIDYLGLIPVLIEATKEQQLVIEKLARQVKKLKKLHKK